jgi:spoIIIJ-associated protein
MNDLGYSASMDSLVEPVLKEILSTLGVSYKGITRKEIAGQAIFTIESDADARLLIGAHGDAIHALDTLVKKIVEKKAAAQMPPGTPPEEALFLIDVNGYRAQRIQELQTKALMMAERARSFQYDVELEPMTAYERLIVHTTLQDKPNIKTESQGEGRGRRVVIRYTA